MRRHYPTKHSHLYGFFDEVCYRLPTLDQESLLRIAPEEALTSTSRTAILPNSTFVQSISLNSADFIETVSNEEYCQTVMDWAKETKATSVTDILNTFKVEISYIIFNINSRYVYDEGVTTQNITPREVVLLNEVSEGNLLSYRKALHLKKTIPFRNMLQASYEMGHLRNEGYAFKVNRIKIKMIPDNGFCTKDLNYVTDAVIDFTGRRKGYTLTSDSEHAITVLDTEDLDVEFPAERIGFRPKSIQIDLDILLNGFFTFYSETDFLKILYDNEGKPSSETGDPMIPCHPNIHPHPGMYIPHPTRPIRPMGPPKPLRPKPEEKPGENDQNPENPPKDPTTPENPGDNTGTGDGNGGGITTPETPGTGENPPKDPTTPENPGDNTGTGDGNGGTTTTPETPDGDNTEGEGTDPENPGNGEDSKNPEGETPTTPDNPDTPSTGEENQTPETEGVKDTNGSDESEDASK